MATATTARRNGRGPRVPLVAQLPTPTPEPETSVYPAYTPTPKLDAAVSNVQAAAEPLMRNATGQIQRRTYTYVTLAAVTDAVLPLLVGEGLVWKTWPTVLDNGAPALRYRMTHIESGQFDEDVMPLLCDPTMQGIGSAVTYARRYALTAYLNLTIDEDDDGASANTAAAAPRYSEATTAPEGTDADAPRPQAAEAKASGRPATVKQRNLIRVRAREAKLSAAQLADIILSATGNEPRKMDEEAAERWIARSLDRLPGKKSVVDAVLAGIANQPPF